MNGKNYHVDCFKCDRCSKPISGKVWTVDDENICSDCYMKDCPTCNMCGEKILKVRGETYSQLDDKFYHSRCLVCHVAGCNKKGILHDNSGKLCCPEHAAMGLTEGEKCEKCGKIIIATEENGMIEAKGMFWHEKCYTCYMCGKPARGGHDGKLFCGRQCMMDDYNGIPPKVVETLATQVSDVEISTKTETEEDNSPLCPICNKSCSTGKTQVWNGKMYHHECLSKCSVCQESHATLSFMGGSMYCEPCKNKFLRGDVDTNATEEERDGGGTRHV